MSEDNKLIEEFLYQVATKNVKEDRNSDFRDVFGTENVGALLSDLDREKASAKAEVFNEPIEPKAQPTLGAVAAEQAAAVSTKGIQVGKAIIPQEQLASMLTNPKFIDILSTVKKENMGKNIRRVGEPPPPDGWKPQVIHRPKV